MLKTDISIELSDSIGTYMLLRHLDSDYGGFGVRPPEDTGQSERPRDRARRSEDDWPPFVLLARLEGSCLGL